MKRLTIILGLLLVSYVLYSQEYIQNIKGQIRDEASHEALPFVNVVVEGTNPQLGAVTDDEGKFTINNVPIGRYNIIASFVGYKTSVQYEVLLESRKEKVLNIYLQEKVTNLDEIVITGSNKDKSLNSMAFIGARTFTVEEANRYAGGLDDPARIASVFAGVGTGGGAGDNSIVIRGNSPKGVLWRIEGVEVLNVNHFEGSNVAGGGLVSMLSSNMLSNSDFLTSAFPAQYGNAISGVFDMKFRKGNTENFEAGIQIGLLGTDVYAEGPLSRKNNSSFIFNYRYSTLALISSFIPELSPIPKYQDLSFKIELPTKKAGTFSIWGLGGIDETINNLNPDTSKWVYNDEKYIFNIKSRTGNIGLSHKQIFKGSTYINTSIVYSINDPQFNFQYFNPDLILTDSVRNSFNETRQTLSSFINHKFSSKHTNRTGIVASNMTYKLNLQSWQSSSNQWNEMVDGEGRSSLLQFFTQSKFNFTDAISLNVGLHGQYFELNSEFNLEPRIGFNWTFLSNNTISLGYGNHSRVEPLHIYFVKGNTTDPLPNQDLKLSKANHYAISFDKRLTKVLRLKLELYHQQLYDIPVVPNSYYSMINYQREFTFDYSLENDGKGENTGVELTFERFLKDNWYFLFTSSIFDSKYSNNNSDWSSSRFDYGYICNALGGYEFNVGKKKNKTVGINLRLTAQGGEYYQPLNLTISNETMVPSFRQDQSFTEQYPSTLFTDFTLIYRINKQKYSYTLGIQLKNILQSKGEYEYRYNLENQNTELSDIIVSFPNIYLRFDI